MRKSHNQIVQLLDTGLYYMTVQMGISCVLYDFLCSSIAPCIVCFPYSALKTAM